MGSGKLFLLSLSAIPTEFRICWVGLNFWFVYVQNKSDNNSSSNNNNNNNNNDNLQVHLCQFLKQEKHKARLCSDDGYIKQKLGLI